MRNSERRHINTRKLMTEECSGKLGVLAERLGKSQPHTSAFAGSFPRTCIGNQIAEEIEKAFGKKMGWLDQDHGGQPSLVLSDPVSIERKIGDVVDSLQEAGVGLDRITYKLTKEEATVLADELIPVTAGKQKKDLSVALKHGYAHRLISGSSLFGLSLVVEK